MLARDYQTRCCEAIIAASMRGHTAILCWLFTGAGKTVIFGLLARMFPATKILIIAHQRELVWQAADTIDRVTGETAGVEMAEFFSNNRLITCASRQTLSRGRHRKFLGTRIVIVDEAHTQMSPGMIAMLNEFREHGGLVIGFTATPFRADGQRLMDFYQTLAFEMPAKAGIEEGYCTPLLAKIVRCGYLDLSKVSVEKGDYSSEDLDMILGSSRAMHQMCLTVQAERVGPAIAFLPRVRTAKYLAELSAREYGLRSAFVCGDEYLQSESERAEILARFRRGEIDLLTNCQVATTGFDAPVTQTIFMFRPTKSRVLATQIWGRSMRPLPGVVDGLETASERIAAIASSAKTHCRIIDLTDSLNHHSLVTAVDEFARDESPEFRAAAREAAAEAKEPLSEEDLMAQAAEKLRKAKLLEEGLALLRGRAHGKLSGTDVSLGVRVRCISEYRVPIRGRFAGRTMGELDDGYIEWALRHPAIKGWQRSYFRREQQRRSALRHA
jgi:superfamily II DNA or RNA helicase